MFKVVAIVVVCAAVGEALGQTPTFEKLLTIPRIGGAKISPDGKRVAYTLSSTDWKENRYRQNLWVVDIATGRRIQLTRGKGIGGYEWCPDSRRIAFGASRDGESQVYLIDTYGGEAGKLTDVKDGVEGFNWSPDGKRLAYGTTPADASLDKRKEKLGSFTVFESDEQRTRLGILDVPDGIPDAPVTGKLLTEKEPFSAESVIWSPDSKRIAIVTRPSNALHHLLETGMYLVDPASGKLTKLLGPGFYSDPVWSPDSKALAFLAAPKLDEAFYANGGVYVVSASGGEPKQIPMNFDEIPELGKWTPQGILFTATIRTQDKLFRVDPGDGRLTELTPQEGSRDDWSFSQDGSMCAYRSEASDRWAEVGVSPVDGFRDKLVTDDGMKAVEKRVQPLRETVRWSSKDGQEIEGVLTMPHDFDSHKKYPLLVVIHGGPTGTSQPYDGSTYAYPIEAWVNRGAVVLEPNYRGSAGYGGAFRALNVRNLGVGDELDVLSGVDSMVKQGFVDEKRMGCMGWSEGGYISAFITTTSDRFTAISIGAGISDWATYYYLTDITDFTRQYLKGTPWSDPEIYRKTSPITYVKGAKTPTLIQQGSNDARVPVPNGFELYRALQDLHVPSKYILYNGFGHGVSNPKEQQALFQHNWEWFGHYIWGDPLPEHE